MDITKVTQWVEKTLGTVIRNEIRQRIQDENSLFDVNSYVNDLLDTYFSESEYGNLKIETLNGHCTSTFNQSEFNISRDEVLHCNLSYTNSLESVDYEINDYREYFVEEIIGDLKNNSEEVRLKSLQALEISVDDLINSTSWNEIKTILESTLLEKHGNKKIQSLVLKIFEKLIMNPNKPQIVCEVFGILVKVVFVLIEGTNSDDENLVEEIYDLKEDRWLYERTPGILEEESNEQKQNPVSTEVLIRSMWLVIECQKQMPEKWIRFNEKRLREIIFSFIHLLSTTSVYEGRRITGLELLSVLNPTSSWCRHWCHTAAGKTLLIAALRKYKNLFIHIVGIIVNHMSAKNINELQFDLTQNKIHSETGNDTSKSSKSLDGNTGSIKEIKKGETRLLFEKNKCVRSAPTVSLKKKYSNIKTKVINRTSDWIIEKLEVGEIKKIPQKIVKLATFCSCLSLVVNLIQFRSGRSLFPIQISARKRLLTVQDITMLLCNYMKNFECDGSREIIFTYEFRRQLLQLLKILQNVKSSFFVSKKCRKVSSILE